MLRWLWDRLRAFSGERLNLQTGFPKFPHPANVPGQFYVEYGCCMTCGVPEDIAPGLFGWVEGETHCYVKKQPETPAEFSQMRDAMCLAEADCIRARFCSDDFLQELAGWHCANLVDTPGAESGVSDHG